MRGAERGLRLKAEPKRCPFCGGEAMVRKTKYEGWVVYCRLCNVRTDYDRRHTVGEAIEQWNTRVADEQKGGEQ